MSKDETVVLSEAELLSPDKPIAAYSQIKDAIARLSEQYGKVEFDVTTPKGLAAATEARAAIRAPRYRIEHIRKALKAPALAYGKRIDAEAKEYTDALLALEEPIDQQIKAEEERKENERRAREEAERAAQQKIADAISEIQFLPVYAKGKASSEVQAVLDELQSRVLTVEEFGVRHMEAVGHRAQALEKLAAMVAEARQAEEEAARQAEVARIAEQQRIERERELEAKRQAQEAEAARLAAERAEIERQRKELEAKKQEAANLIGAGTAATLEPLKEAADVARSFGAQSMAAALDPIQAAPEPEADEPPTADEIVDVVADHWDVAPFVARRWLQAAFGKGA